MKILWVKSDFLHPTTKGGHIRTLEMLRRLHTRHDVHYVALEDRTQPEGLARSGEYCSHAYPVPHDVPPRRSLRFLLQLVAGLWSRKPVSISRYESGAMRGVITKLLAQERFDCVVCDFLTPAVNFSSLHGVVLFQHNVESIIWERHANTASNPLARFYFRLQASRMLAWERYVCRQVQHIVAVSAADAQRMREMFDVTKVADVPTGVDLEFFAPSGSSKRVADLVFVGSMDWLPNIDAIRFFVADVLPLIRRARPNCSLAVVGRLPGPEITAFAANDPNILVTGTVKDVRPYLWGSTVSVVPLRIGGGTRLKIYEAIAAKVPVVSTTIGAEGLDVTAPTHIRLADTAEAFAAECVALLDGEAERMRLAAAAWESVSSRFSWETVTRQFEKILEGSGQSVVRPRNVE
jgi:glycosyltransferase involved in cell wall biosynthesis